MDDIRFPVWVYRSPVFTMASVLGRRVRQQLLAVTTATSQPPPSYKGPDSHRVSSLFHANYNDRVNILNQEERLVPVFLSGSMRVNDADDLHLNFAPASHSKPLDVLSHPHVALIIKLSQAKELMSQEVSVSVKNAPALISLMALAVEWRSLPSDHTKRFYAECASLYTSLMRRLNVISFFPGVDVQGFVASLVSCGLLLRCDEREIRNGAAVVGDVGEDRPVLAGFEGRIVDSVILSCISSNFDDCVQNPIALGALQGLTYTTREGPAYLSPKLVMHLHSLTDAFTTSSRRKELLYKQLLCYIMEAISCAHCVDYARMRNWLAALLQPDYILKGLLQKEDIHARVAAATLTLLTRWLQDVVVVCNSSSRRNGGSQEQATTFLAWEEILEIDKLIEGVWTALHQALDKLKALHKTDVTLHGDNLRIIVEHLLLAELKRVQCYRIISGVQQQATTQEEVEEEGGKGNGPEETKLVKKSKTKQQDNDAAFSFSYVPSMEEEDLRLRVIGNILSFLLVPTSVFSATTAKPAAMSLRQDITEWCAKVIALTASTDGGVTSLGRRNSRCSSFTTARFSSNFYNGMESIARELILRVLEASTLGASSKFSTIEEEKEEEGIRIAALCLQSLCATNSHIRSFSVTEVLDAVMYLPTARKSVDLLRGNNEDGMGSVSMESRRLLVCFAMMNRVLVSRHRSIFKPLSYEGVLRLGQLLFDTFEDTLRGHVGSGNLADPEMDFPCSRMLVIAESFWRLVQRCNERIRVMTREGLRLTVSHRKEVKVQLTEAFNEESKILRLLLRSVLRCMINVAWPDSGILYSAGPSRGDRRPGFDITTIALASLSLFFRPLCLLCQLSTLFPVTDVRHLMYHHENAEGLTRMDSADSFLHHYCFQPNNMNSPFWADNGMAQFRSWWFMLSYYRFTNEALLRISRDETLSPSSDGKYHQFKYSLKWHQARWIRLLAASTPPLMYMRSSDYQQAMADIHVLERHLTSSSFGTRVGAAAAAITKRSGCATYQKEVLQSLRICCPELGNRKVKKLSFSEFFLANSLATLEMLRASCGSISTITQYQHFEIREFDARKEVQTAVGQVTAAVTRLYLSTLQGMLPDVAANRIDENARQLVLLYGFAIDSVRRSAKEILSRIIKTFPAFTTSSTALPLLWSVINLLDKGRAAEVQYFCKKFHFTDAPAVAMDPNSFERRKQVQDAVSFAEYWVDVARRHSPMALLGHSSVFTFEEEMSCRGHGPGAGSSLAVRAYSVDTGSSKLTQDYAQCLIKRSDAQGQVMAASCLAQSGDIGNLLLGRLRAMLGDSMRAISTGAESKEHHIESCVKHPRVMKTGRERNSDDDDDDYNDGKLDDNEGDKVKKWGKMIREELSFYAPKEHISLDMNHTAMGQLHEADALLCMASAFLATAKVYPSTQLELLRCLVQGPIHLFTSHYIAAAIQCWKWLLFERREKYAVPLLVQVVEGFLWTISERIGLFDGSRPSQKDEVESGDRTASMQSMSIYLQDYKVNSPHKLLIEFLFAWYVDIGSPLSFCPSVLLILQHLAMRVVESPSRFSIKDASFSETMRCALMISTICSNLQTVNERRLRVGLSPLVTFDSICAIRRGWYRCLLQWFRKIPPSWYFTRDPSAAEEELKALEKLMQVLDMDRNALSVSVDGFLDSAVLGKQTHHPHVNSLRNENDAEFVVRGGMNVTSVGGNSVNDVAVSGEKRQIMQLIGLLRLLVQHEHHRLMLWLRPQDAPVKGWGYSDTSTCESVWKIHCNAAATHDPAVLIALVARFPNPQVVSCAVRHVSENPEAYCHIPEAVDLYLNDVVLMRGCPGLYLFSDCSIVQALRFLDKRYTTRLPRVSAYALRSLLSQKSESLIFYLPQILQALSESPSDDIVAFLRRMCSKSDMFTHQLLWSLQAEGGELNGGEELSKKCLQLASEVRQGFDHPRKVFHDGEFSFIQKIISLSGEMKLVEKAQRKKVLRRRLRNMEFHELIANLHLYLPTDPNWRIIGLVPGTAGVMQSAAKCPILVEFLCVHREHDDMDPSMRRHTVESHSGERESVVKACIFKMGDDCRQDQIALQLIGLFQRIFNSIQVPSFLYPYRVVAAGKGCGIIECVPRALSRDQIGKLVESNIAEYFVQTYGHPESVTFHQARDCFIRSMASYSVASFVLNIKDRHNGNIMVDGEGHVVHIDFGFLFDFSPGGDINFESSPFKLTAEMLQLMGHPVGKGKQTVQSSSLARALVDPESYSLFVDLTLRCYLAVRQYARQVCVLVELMLGCALPCFNPQRTIQDLAWRLSMNKDEAEASQFMLKRIAESKENLRTVLYDKYQNFAEGIEM